MTAGTATAGTATAGTAGGTLEEKLGELATLENATAWLGADRAAFCLDLLGVNARWPGADAAAGALEDAFLLLLVAAGTNFADYAISHA